MELLLDTNILIALIDGRLDKRLGDALAHPESFLHVSVASLWEIAIKLRLGKISLNAPLKHLPELIESMGMKLLAIEAAHVLGQAVPEPATRDPFDRLLLSQCSIENLRLVTHDRILAEHPLAWTGT